MGLRNRSLLRELVITDFKLRYQGSVLGYLWSLVRPLALFTVLYVVFSRFFKFGDAIPHFPAYLLLGIVLWTFFVEATNAGMHAILGRGDLIRKVNLPKYIIVLSTSVSSLVNLTINLLVVAVFILFTGAEIGLGIILLPVLILELFVLSIALSFLLSALLVRFRDVAYIWELLLQILFYATPIIYPLTLVPERFQSLVLLNPLAQIIQDVRHLAITPATPSGLSVSPILLVVVPWLIVIVLAVLASVYFKRQSQSFAENL